MPADASKSPLSPPFADRELNGEVLLRELAALREGQVRQAQLNDCAAALAPLPGLRVSQTILRIRDLATGRFQAVPALASTLVRWAAKLKTEADVEALVGHFQRLAVTSALISAVRRGADRLPGADPNKSRGRR